MKDFSIIGLRLLSIWTFLKALLLTQYLPTLFVSDIDEFGNMGGYEILISFAIYLISSIILFFFAPALSNKISFSDEQNFPEVNLKKLTSIFFATAGILIFFWSINTFLNSINSIFYYRTVDPNNVSRAREIRLVLLGGGIQMIFGLALFVGGKRIAQWWHDFRNWT